MKRNCVYNYIRNNYVETKDKNIVIHLRYKRDRETRIANYILKLNSGGGYDTYKLNNFKYDEKVKDDLILTLIWTNSNIIRKMICESGFDEYKTELSYKYIDLTCEV